MTESERSYSKINESIKSIAELTTRVDERVRLIMQTQEVLNEKIDAQTVMFNDLNMKVNIMEIKNAAYLSAIGDVQKLEDQAHKMDLRLAILEGSSNNQEARWKTVFTFAIQLMWVVVAAYVLYKLGIQAPATP